MVMHYAIIGALVAFLPGASFFLIPLEVWLVYRIAIHHHAYEFGTFITLATGLATISMFLKALAALLHFLPLVGQIANSLVAFGFILILGSVAEQHYEKKARRQG